MTKNKPTHTPGPWKICRIGKIRTRPVVYSDAGGYTKICTFSSAATGDATEANARLISAAPDLLAALNRALSLIEDLPKSALDAARMGGVYVQSVSDEARAAIAKAEGR